MANFEIQMDIQLPNLTNLPIIAIINNIIILMKNKME